MSGPVVIQTKPAALAMNGIEYLVYAARYLAAAEHLKAHRSAEGFDPLPYQLLCQSLELYLKSFIWLADRSSRNAIKHEYGHDLVKLWHAAKARKLSRYCEPTRTRDQAIALVGPYYKSRRFAYLDLAMSWQDIPKLRSDANALPVLARLCRRLEHALTPPVLSAS